MNSSILKLTARWLAAIVFLWYAVRLLLVATRSDQITALAGCLFGMAFLISAVVMIVPEAVPWAAAPLLALLDAIYLPGASDPPPLNYKTARFYRQQCRWEEAVQEYRKIVHYHPRELVAYIEGIETAFEAGEHKAAVQLYRKGCRRLRSKEDRLRLQRVYEECQRVNAAQRTAATRPALL